MWHGCVDWTNSFSSKPEIFCRKITHLIIIIVFVYGLFARSFALVLDRTQFADMLVIMRQPSTALPELRLRLKLEWMANVISRLLQLISSSASGRPLHLLRARTFHEYDCHSGMRVGTPVRGTDVLIDTRDGCEQHPSNPCPSVGKTEYCAHLKHHHPTMPMSRAPELKATRLETLLLRELRACWLYRSVPVGASLCSCCHRPVRIRRQPNLVKTRRTRVWKPVVRELCIQTRVDNLNEHVSEWDERESVFLVWLRIPVFFCAVWCRSTVIRVAEKENQRESEACNFRENRFDLCL